MKTLKKMFAIVLSMAMLVTGLYLVPAKADKVQATGTVATPPDGVLNVKAQTTKTLVNVTDTTDENYQYNGQYVLRMISSIDCLDYSQVGFRVTYEDETTKETKTLWNTTDTVYERIDSTTDVAKYSFSPKIIDTDAEYFITAKLAVPADKTARNYTVEAFCDPLGGGTRIYGPKRCVAVDDVATTILSFGIDVADTLTLSTVEGAYTATVTSQVNADEDIVTKNGTVEVLSSEAGYANVRVTLTDGTVADLASVSTVSIKEEGTEVASTTYRNYDTSYLSGTYAGKPDTSWYTLQPSGDTGYVVATNADLYGLSVVSQTDNFDGDTVHLIADIKANNGTASLENGWTAATSDGTSYPWTPMNESGVKFAGTFDGNLHTIEGIYATNTEASTEANKGFVGLFSETAPDSTVKELLVKNSYFSKSGATSDVYAGVGSIIGHCGSNLEKVYSSAIVKTADKVIGCGGLVGQVYSTGTVTMKECNFAGTVSASANGNGGFIGQAKRGNIVLQDCINNGLISTISGFTGGLIGRTIMAQSEYGLSTFEGGVWNITLKNCLNRGTVDRNASNVGALVGQDWGQVEWDRSNVYIMEGSNERDYGSNAVNSGESASRTSDQLTGTNAYQWLSFDFENVWTIVDGDYPIQQCFAETIVENEFMPRMGWYNGNSNVTEFTISTAEELYGFSYLNNTDDSILKNDTVKLGANITVNEGTVEEWEKSDFAGLRTFTPIGTGKPFRGHFNGQGHTISGLYIIGNGTQGLFANAYGDNIKIQNFNLVNTYIKSTDNNNGSIAGNFRGTMESIYSDAKIVVTGGRAGGFVGRLDSNSTFNNCWFAGEIEATSGSNGGIYAVHMTNSAVTIKNCLVTGSITTTASNGIGGGFMGQMWFSADATTTNVRLDIESSVFAGTLSEPSNNADVTGLMVGQAKVWNESAGIYITNSYGVNKTSNTWNTIGKVEAGIFATDDAGTNKYTGACEGLNTNCRKTLSELDVTDTTLGLDSTIWTNSTNGPILSAFEAIHTSVNAGN